MYAYLYARAITVRVRVMVRSVLGNKPRTKTESSRPSNCQRQIEEMRACNDYDDMKCLIPQSRTWPR